MIENPFELLNVNREKNLTIEEVISAVRLAMNLENDAVRIYRYIAENCGHSLVKKCFLELADEEVVHIGELVRLIFQLDDKERELYLKGFKETEDKIKKS